ncbi:MAG: FAD-dependent oxidoreductase [Desulfobacterales bacterium]|nr:FAD-dependent oxidoreductase [Desulfobacterales bacterium]
MRVIVVGGGWGGCAAALSVKKRGAESILLERTDMLLGTGLVGGIMRNNGRYTATEELIAMGEKDIFNAIDGNLLHRDINFPGHRHASLYNVARMEPVIKRLLTESGVQIHLMTRVTDVEMNGARITALKAKRAGESVRLEGDAFIDTTGTAGPPAQCNKYGNGCVMCVLRCHTFGGRVSVAAKAGVNEFSGQKGGQTGAFSGACKLHKESLADELLKELNTTGKVVVPIPPALKIKGKLALKACQQYALKEFEDNVILLDTGHAKLMSPFFPLEMLREIPGFECARYEDPYSGGLGNSVRYIGMSSRDDALKVDGVDNLYCAGEKAGLLVGHTEAICTGTLAGYNAVGYVMGEPPLVLPDSLAIGDGIRYTRQQMVEHGRLDLKFTFSGSVLFDRMNQRESYITDVEAIARRVKAAGLSNVFAGSVE